MTQPISLEKQQALDALMSSAQGGSVRAIKNDLRELLMTAESTTLLPLKETTGKKQSLHRVTKELALENM